MSETDYVKNKTNDLQLLQLMTKPLDNKIRLTTNTANNQRNKSDSAILLRLHLTFTSSNVAGKCTKYRLLHRKMCKKIEKKIHNTALKTYLLIYCQNTNQVNFII